MLRRLTAAFICFLMLCVAPALSFDAPQSLSNADAVVLKPYKPTVFVNFTLVRRIFCAKPTEESGSIGTGVVISENVIMTAAHVLVEPTCLDVGASAPLTILYIDRVHDIAFLRINDVTFKNWFNTSCFGFQPNKEYAAIGYRYGDDLVETHVVATDFFSPDFAFTQEGSAAPHLRLMLGDIYKGMSGGPIVDEDGVVVGLNTATDNKGAGFSREIRDTILCNSKHSD